MAAGATAARPSGASLGWCRGPCHNQPSCRGVWRQETGEPEALAGCCLEKVARHQHLAICGTALAVSQAGATSQPAGQGVPAQGRPPRPGRRGFVSWSRTVPVGLVDVALAGAWEAIKARVGSKPRRHRTTWAPASPSRECAEALVAGAASLRAGRTRQRRSQAAPAGAGTGRRANRYDRVRVERPALSWKARPVSAATCGVPAPMVLAGPAHEVGRGRRPRRPLVPGHRAPGGRLSHGRARGGATARVLGPCTWPGRPWTTGFLVAWAEVTPKGCLEVSAPGSRARDRHRPVPAYPPTS